MSTKTQDPVIGDGSLHVGDRVVYPNQGICRITGVEIKQIAGQNWEVVTLSREEDGATVMVPKAKVMGIGLRKVADVAAIDRVFDELSTPNTDPQLDWKVRHRENADRMTGGGLFGTVEVLKGLHALSRLRPLPPKERELYDNARHLLVGEIAAAMNSPLHVAEDNLDYALWPPEGMTRKGRPLPPATLGPPSPARASGLDDDLGFEDEAVGGAAEAAPAAAPAAAEEAGREGQGEGERKAMIRIVTLSEFPPDVVDFVSRRLHAAYGMGSELEGEGEIPSSALDDEQSAYDAVKTLEEMDDDVALYADDKILYLTSEPLTAPEGPMGRGPVDGYAQYGAGKAIATSHGLADKGVPLEVGLAKRAAHYVGHLWDLHHCYDPRCAMHPGWSPGFAAYPEVALCLFCREKSERKIKLGST